MRNHIWVLEVRDIDHWRPMAEETFQTREGAKERLRTLNGRNTGYRFRFKKYVPETKKFGAFTI